MNDINFEKSEIITIVKEILIELENQYIVDDEFYLPEPIEKKIDKLSIKEREYFFDICTEIAQEVLKLKSGELNEINMIHNEIIYLAEIKLLKYINMNR